MTVEPVTLEGDFVRLEPLGSQQLEELCAIGLDPELWRWGWSALASPEDVRRYI